MKITKQWVVDHLDEVEAALQLLGEVAGGGKAVREAEVVGRVTVEIVRSLLTDAPPVTRAELDARVAALRDTLAAHDLAADTALDARFPTGDGES